MDIRKPTVSGGSEGCLQFGVMDEGKRKRMLSNRESARRSRMKKLKQMDDLVGQVTRLKDESKHMVRRIAGIEQSYMYVAAEKDMLEAEAMALTNRLHCLNELLYFTEQINDLAMDVTEIPELFIEPWQLPYQAPQFTASARVFQC